ncbi:hypothetical protein Acr_09g0002390 [Actinidia rufa]|uniref:RNase H type-1 domain-containing protein n=1 Tax=Actinidia rufa TaxID=165716 RepID=A0A7J0F5B4_9ERIC|nr:hypothetical protein Acr_09g0002390 [Actinidia rufa]
MGSSKLNTDGATRGQPGDSATGGLVRNYTGDWVMTYSRNIGVSTSLGAELWSLRDALRRARDTVRNGLDVEMDSKAVVLLVMIPVEETHQLSSLLCDCKWILQELQVSRVNHVFREANQCACRLANEGLHLEGLFVYESLNRFHLWGEFYPSRVKWYQSRPGPLSASHQAPPSGGVGRVTGRDEGVTSLGGECVTWAPIPHRIGKERSWDI